MSGFGGVVTFEIDGDLPATSRFIDACRIPRIAPSLGGVESLIEHRASVEGPESRTPASLLRVSIGLEHPDDLIADLEQALAESG
jgi:cystathionine gamma-synthase